MDQPNFNKVERMPEKKKILPNTIRITKAHVGTPRSYTDNQVKEIAHHLGDLPAGKILYPSGIPPFHILGEEQEDLFQSYMQDGPIKKMKMTREMALLYCLEGAAWKYKNNKREKRTTPSEKLKTLARFEDACDVLIKGVGSFDFLRWWEFPDLEKNVQKTLIPLKKEIQYQKKAFSQMKAPNHKRHRHDDALHGFILDTCNIWVHVAGRKFSTGSISSDGKKTSGPLIRFIQAAAAPLEIKTPAGGIRKILRDIKAKSKL